jgi:hypothetical protein
MMAKSAADTGLFGADKEESHDREWAEIKTVFGYDAEDE